MLSKFSGQIGPKPNVLCSIKKVDRSDRLAVLMESAVGGGGGGGRRRDLCSHIKVNLYTALY